MAARGVSILQRPKLCVNSAAGTRGIVGLLPTAILSVTLDVV